MSQKNIVSDALDEHFKSWMEEQQTTGIKYQEAETLSNQKVIKFCMKLNCSTERGLMIKKSALA